MKRLHESSKRSEINLSIKFRIIPVVAVLFILSIVDFLSSSYTISKVIYVLSFFYCIVLWYLYKIKINHFLNIWGYILPTLDVLMTSALFLTNNPEARSYTMVSIYIIYTISIALTSLQAYWKYTIYSGIVSVISHFLISIYFYSCITKSNASIYIYDTLLIDFYYIILASILSIKNFVRDRSFDEARNLVLERYVTAAHMSLLPEDGSHHFQNWSIKTIVDHRDMIGADFIGIKEGHDGSIVIVLGDVTSHGIDVSPIAHSCLSVFHGTFSTNPTNILKDMNRVAQKIGKKNGGEALAIVMQLLSDGTIIYNGMIGTEVIFVPKDGGASMLRSLQTNGFILGKNETEPGFFDDKKIKLESGDKIILYTDGLDDDQLSDDFSQVVIKYKGR